METETKERIGRYVGVLGELRRLGITDSELAATIINQVGKDARMEAIRAERGSAAGLDASNGEQPATSKQKDYLKALGVEIPAGLTKQHASELIDEAVGSAA